MKSPLWLLSPIALAVLLAGCGGEAYTWPMAQGSLNTPGGGTGPSYPAANWTKTPEVLLTANNRQQMPTAEDSFNGRIPLAHLGVTGIDCGFEFTTPANTPFSFTVNALVAGNSGGAVIKAGHSLPALAASYGGESIQVEGMVLDGPGLAYAGNWWQVVGDGAVHMDVRGKISRDQLLVFEVVTAQVTSVQAVRLKIGAGSDINFGGGNPGGTGTLSRTTVFSSDQRGFGLPAIAVSGDRYSLACYDTDPGAGRLRRWLQYNDTTGAVTGGEGVSAAPDTGNWRDQEIAAFNNVLAVAYTGNDEVRAEISLDRGATFPIEQVLNEYSAAVGGQRLVQIEIAPDYRLAIAYWRSLLVGYTIQSDLCVAEATPTGFDSNNTPTGYAFSAPWVVHSVANWVVPTVMDLEYSSAGDLVVGYGYNENFGWQSTVSFRLTVRPASGGVTSQLIDSESTSWGNDPSVALIGSGANMRIFYAYEKADGIHLVELRNGGSVIGNVCALGAPGAFLPSVHARMQGNVVKVDLLYIAPADYGFSLKHTHWDDFYAGFGMAQHGSLFESSSAPGGTPLSPTIPGLTVETVGWMGYDAVTSGDDVAIALHTATWDVYEGVNVGAPGTPPPAQYSSGGSTTVLLPGMQGYVPPPNASHRNQLEVIVID